MKFVGILLVALAALLLAACGDDGDNAVPDGEPGPRPTLSDASIRGFITSKTDATDGEDSLGRLLIEGQPSAEDSSDKATVRIDDQTEILRQVGEEQQEASWGDLAEGQTVDAWFEGTILLSDPLQAYAGKVVIIE